MKEETFKQCEKENVRHIVVWVNFLHSVTKKEKKRKEK